MKKTLLVTNQFPPNFGGVETYLYNICKRLDPKKLVVLAEEGEAVPLKKDEIPDQAKDFDKKQNYKTIRAPFWYEAKFIWPRWLPLLKKIREVVQSEKIEQIIAGQVLPIGTASMIAAHTYNIPFHVCTYALDIEIAHKHWRRRRTLQKVLKNTRTIFTISEDTRRRIQKAGGDAQKIKKITPGLDLEEFLPSEEKLNTQTAKIKERLKLSDKKIILTIGRLVARKGQDMVIKAMPEILKSVPNAHYVIAGGGEYEDELKKLIKENGLEKDVTMVGKFDEDEKASFYNIADVFAMTSRIEKTVDIEGFGIVYLEANALKKPVLGARVGGVEDAIAENESGLLADDPKDVNEIAKSITKLLKDQDLAQRLGEQGFTRVKNKFDWDNIVDEMKNYL